MHWGMLAGLGGAAIPIVIHLLNRRRTTVVDWGAMQFLELGRRARLKFRLSELLLLAGRMALLAIVALALARPFWIVNQPAARAADGAGGMTFFGGPRRDVVLVFDGSGSMGRQAGQTTARDQAIAWARRLIAKLGAGDSVAVLVAKDRVTPLVAPASFDMNKVAAALADLPRPRGASDLPIALAEALRLLEAPGNPAREVIILTDGQRSAWRPDEPARWALPREIHRGISRLSGVAPRMWVIRFGGNAGPAGPNGSVGPLEFSDGLVTPDRPITITTTVSNNGSESMTRAAGLAIDGQPVPGTEQVVGPLPAGGKMPLSFNTSLAQPGSHVVTVRLTGDDDALADDDESSRSIEVTAALPVLLIDGEPGVEPLTGETDFLRAALAPSGADAVPVRARVVTVGAFGPGDLKGQRVAVLANVERLEPRLVTAIDRFIEAGAGVLIAPGDKVDVGFNNATLYHDGAGWVPTRIGATRGEADRRQTIAHPDPRTFIGPALAALGQGESPPLAAADLFQYQVLEPAKGAAVVARLDTGDPWIVERPFGKGRVAMLAGPIDAEGGTLPVNPDYVPLVHELIYHLASASAGARSIYPGEPIVLDLNPPPLAGVETLRVTAPGGALTLARVVRSGEKAQARVDDTAEPGIYQIHRPEPPGGSAFAAVAADPRESDLRPLDPDLAATLAGELPLTFESDPDRLTGQLFAGGPQGRREIWRFLILATLAGLCMEIWLTRRMVKNSGIADLRTADDAPGIDTIPLVRAHA
jgi:von Willebrand factor type A domain/Aerotolerance regulator N-terminal